MIELKITGQDVYDFSLQVASLSTVFDVSTHPWDYPKIAELVKKQHEHSAELKAQQEKRDQGATTIEPDNHNYQTPAPAAEKPAPAATAPAPSTPAPKAPAAPAPSTASQGPADTYISLADLQKKCVDLGDAYGQPVFQQLKAEAGFVSMKALDAAGRKKFADMIDKYAADHPRS